VKRGKLKEYSTLFVRYNCFAKKGECFLNEIQDARYAD
jgi:hypothetical protein